MRRESVAVSLFISSPTLSYECEGEAGWEKESWEEGKGAWVEETGGRERGMEGKGKKGFGGEKILWQEVVMKGVQKVVWWCGCGGG